jgi:hypothetical protein
LDDGLQPWVNGGLSAIDDGFISGAKTKSLKGCTDGLSRYVVASHVLAVRGTKDTCAVTSIVNIKVYWTLDKVKTAGHRKIG